MIIFSNFSWKSPSRLSEVICECCAAYLEDLAVSKERRYTTYYRHPISKINTRQDIPSKGIVVANELGDVSKIRIEDVLDVVNLGGDDNLYIRSSLEEYPFD